RPKEVALVIEYLRKALEQLRLPPTRYVGIAELFYRAGQPHEAIRHWRAAAMEKREEPDWLLRSYAETEPYPDNLKHVIRLKDDKALIEAWRRAGQEPGKEWMGHVLMSARKLKDWEAIEKLLPHSDSIAD